MSANKKTINLTKVPLLFAEGARLKKAARWNSREILTAGTFITPMIIDEYADVAMHIPVSLRVEGSISEAEKLVEENIRKYRASQKAEKVQDLSEQYTEGDMIFEQGDTENQDCFFLTEGAVSVVIGGNTIATIDEPGQPIGEMSFLTGEPRSASIVAAGPCKLLRVPYVEKRRTLRQNPTIVHTLLESLVRRLGDTSKRFTDTQTTMHTSEVQLEKAKHDLAAAETRIAQLERELELLRDLQDGQPADKSAPPEAWQEKFRTLAEFAAAEAAEKLGNLELLRQLLAVLEDRTDAEGVLAPMQAYLAYLDSAPRSRAVSPRRDDARLPEQLRQLLGE